MVKATDIVITEEATKGFYPTPPRLAEKLLEGIKWEEVETILEPSAGKGNLVMEIAEKVFDSDSKQFRYADRGLDVDCIEIDPFLQSILEYEFGGQHAREIGRRIGEIKEKQRKENWDKKYPEFKPEDEEEKRLLNRELIRRKALSFHLVHDDFLTFDSRKHYSLIVMNPPFANGADHLLKAIEMQKRFGGQIRCILNAETLLNPYTNKRKVLKSQLDELGAEIEYVEEGFTDGERYTDVNVALIKISIPEKKEDSEIFQRLSKAADVDEDNVPDVTDMAVTDFMEQIVRRFNVEVDAGLELIRQYRNMRPYVLQRFDEAGDIRFAETTLILSVAKPDNLCKGRDSITTNRYLRLVRRKYWSALFCNKEIMGKFTSNLQDKYKRMLDKMEEYDFTMFNIQKIVTQMNAEMGQGVQDAILSLFDRLTEKHSWYPETEKNIHYFNGWKTNKVHKINSKVILPVNGMFSDYRWEKKAFEVRKAEEVISDIEKALNYLDGNTAENVDLHDVLIQACDAGQTKNIPCKHFDVTLYKKGTMHIKFRNQDLVDRFNIYCCRKKNWLPPNYGRTEYRDMTEDEKAVVDGFNGDGSEGAGEAAYEKVVAMSSYFLAEPTKAVPALIESTTLEDGK